MTAIKEKKHIASDVAKFVLVAWKLLYCWHGKKLTCKIVLDTPYWMRLAGKWLPTSALGQPVILENLIFVPFQN